MKKEEASGESTAVKPAPDSACKKAYQSPVLRTFGSLHRMTQGSTGRRFDAVTRRNTSRIAGGGSDRTIKENVVRIGAHPLGIGLYLFDYKPEYRGTWGHGRQFGVMADEVATVMPEAVADHPDGYKIVDYDMLGISRTS